MVVVTVVILVATLIVLGWTLRTDHEARKANRELDRLMVELRSLEEQAQEKRRRW